MAIISQHLHQELFALRFLCLTQHVCMFKLLFSDAERLHPKLDANGNCESGDKVSLWLFLCEYTLNGHFITYNYIIQYNRFCHIKFND